MYPLCLYEKHTFGFLQLMERFRFIGLHLTVWISSSAIRSSKHSIRGNDACCNLEPLQAFYVRGLRSNLLMIDQKGIPIGQFRS